MQAVNKFVAEQNVTGTPQTETNKAADEYIFIRSDRKMVKVNFTEILYIESLSDYIKIHLEDKTVITRETITNIEALLPSQIFIRVHRSYIVSIPKISSYTNEFVEIGNKEIPISRTYKNYVLGKLGEL